MPRDIEIEDLHGKACLFLPNGHKDNGERNFYPPEEINVRWDKSSSQAQLANGETVTLDGKVVVEKGKLVAELM